jgi:hypothetical protein
MYRACSKSISILLGGPIVAGLVGPNGVPQPESTKHTCRQSLLEG